MTKVVLGAFLVAHGLVHLGVWNTPKGEGPRPFDPAHSWFLEALGIPARPARMVSVVLGIAATAVLVLAGGALLAESEAWRALTVIGASTSLVLVVLYFNRWLTAALVMNAALVGAIVWANWPEAAVVGA